MPVQMRTILEVADNSGAKKLSVILPLGGSTGLKAALGDIITASHRARVRTTRRGITGAVPTYSVTLQPPVAPLD